MIDGQFDMGMRGLDHNCIISLAPDELSHSEKWNYIHSMNIVRLVPETRTALINVGQILSVSQIELITSTDYEVEEY